MADEVSPMSAIIRRLDRADARYRSDGLLDVVLVTAHVGFPFPVGMIVDGVVVRGVLTQEGVLAAKADSAMARATEGLSDLRIPDDRRAMSEVYKDRVAALELRREKDRAIAERYLGNVEDPNEDFVLDDVAVEDSEAFSRDTSMRKTIALKQAHVETSRGLIEVGAIEVVVSHIGAWWPLEEESGASITYVSPADSG